MISEEERNFVLCPQCRQSLRVRKANRAAQGKCVHCSGPLGAPLDPSLAALASPGQFKVCQRCRENDKIRRTNLERMGNCNRCAKALDPALQGKHKVCTACRQKKKKRSLSSPSELSSDLNGAGMMSDPQQQVPAMNFVPGQAAMMMPNHIQNMSGGQINQMQNQIPGQMAQYPMGPMGQMNQMGQMSQDFFGQYQPVVQPLQHPMAMPQALDQQNQQQMPLFSARGRLQ